MRLFLIKAIKFFVAIFLLPLFPPMVLGIWKLATGLSERVLFFTNPLSLCLGGLLLWFIFSLFFQLPPRIYVFAHELTHALFIKLFGGRIKKISVNHDSGFVISDRSNFVIVLAPYLFPFYATIFGCAAFILSLLAPSPHLNTSIWVGMGLCLGYHWTMTGKMLTTRQSDFSSQGYFFSFVLILLVNLSFILMLLLLLPTPQHLLNRLQTFGENSIQSYIQILDFFHQLIKKI